MAKAIGRAEFIRRFSVLAEEAQKAANEVPTWTGDDDDLAQYRALLEVRDHAREATVLLLPTASVKMVRVGKKLCSGCGDNHAPFMCP